MKKPISDEQRAENESTRSLFIQKGMEAEIEREQKDAAALAKTLDEALDDSNHPSHNDDPTTTKWEELKRHARFTFPQLALPKFRDVLPKHKLIAIADAEGWPKTEIAMHGAISRTSVQRILARPDVLLFQREYKELQGRGDPSTKVVELANLGLGITKRLLSMSTSDPAVMRLQLDAAKWAKEQAYPGGRKQVGDLDEAKLMEALASKNVQLDDEVLFADDRKKKTKTVKIKKEFAEAIEFMTKEAALVEPVILDNNLAEPESTE